MILFASKQASWTFLVLVAVFINVTYCLVPKAMYSMVGHEVYSVSTDLQFVNNHPKCNLLNEAYKRTQSYFFNSIYKEDTAASNSQIDNITVTIKNDCVDDNTHVMWPTEDMDESYQLSVQKGFIEIKSNEVWGILRALTTISQMIYRNKYGTLQIKQSVIYDKPRFVHRGIMLDTSRHFLPMKYLLENLELMYLNKMNVFHWHIVDDPSFPYQSNSYPDLSGKGSFRNMNYVYTQYDVLEILNEARIRGIRVIPEFDTPGHSLSWGKGIKNLLTQCYSNKKPNGFGPIDPTKEANFQFLKNFFKEILSVFPDNYLHLGGDEVNFNCWRSNPAVVNFTAKHGFPNDFSKLQGYYMVRLINTIQGITPKKTKQRNIVWQEVFDTKNNVSKESTLIHVWKGTNSWQNEMKAVTASNYKALLSSCWYLNDISYGIDWHSAYSCDPQKFPGGKKDNVMGGEACMWGEFVDETNLIARLWPRASVIAERLWSPKNVTNVADMSNRLNDFRCKLLMNKFQVETVIGPGTFCDRPGKMAL